MDISKFIENAERIFTILAMIAGGFWAYFHYFRGRVYKPRLELDISGKVIRKGEVDYLVAMAELRNVGLSKVKLEQRGSGLRVSSIDQQTSVSKTRNVTSNRLITVSVFRHHERIESGETVYDQKLIGIPKNQRVALMLELRIVAHKTAWRAIKILEIT